jgi:hypothetical protein
MNVSFTLPSNVEKVVEYIAAAPSETHASFTGSHMPFHSIEQAFFCTPNKGIITITGNIASFKLPTMPNSFYSSLNVIVPQSVYIVYKVDGKICTTRIVLGHLPRNRSIKMSEKRRLSDIYPLLLDKKRRLSSRNPLSNKIDTVSPVSLFYESMSQDKQLLENARHY